MDDRPPAPLFDPVLVTDRLARTEERLESIDRKLGELVTQLSVLVTLEGRRVTLEEDKVAYEREEASKRSAWMMRIAERGLVPGLAALGGVVAGWFGLQGQLAVLPTIELDSPTALEAPHPHLPRPTP